MTLGPDVHCVADVGAILGEGPIWHPGEGAVYWLDIKGRKIFRLGGDGQVREWATPYQIGSLVIRKAGGFLAGTEHGFADVELERPSFAPFCDPEPDRPENRFNDGKVDRHGRFWAGTMHAAEKANSGALYRLAADRSFIRVDDDYAVTNGPAFSASGRLMYHNDSGRQLTYVFDLDEAGTPSNRRLFASYAEGQGFPDGMTVDAEDCLWIAFWDGWCVRRFAPSGECIATIDLPVQKPTSCVFGGPALDRLYVTSASIGLNDDDRRAQPCAGGLFMLDTGCVGLPETPFQG